MHIAVTGNIGAGKTTLTTMLAKHYGWSASTRMWITIPIWMISIKICPNGLSPCRCIFWEVDLDRSKKLERVEKISFRTERFTKMPIFLRKILMR